MNAEAIESYATRLEQLEGALVDLAELENEALRNLALAKQTGRHDLTTAAYAALGRIARLTAKRRQTNRRHAWNFHKLGARGVAIR